MFLSITILHFTTVTKQQRQQQQQQQQQQQDLNRTCTLFKGLLVHLTSIPILSSATAASTSQVHASVGLLLLISGK
jgi:HJR/Mrr/RecB family endonuclease